ncbi:MAG: FtsW/RodA/SpoVE family cell cycle protein, partial [Blastocatellia bacterium]
MRERTHTFEFDWWLLTIVMTICLVGLLEIYSSTHGSVLHGMQWKQLTWIAIGLGGMLILSRIDYNVMLDQSPLLYMIGLAALLLVLAVGHTRFGARRWIVVGGVVLQVSELVKLIIIIVLARYFSEVRSERLRLSDLAKIGLLVGIPAGLILLQPDLGTAMVLVPVAIVGAFLAGINWKHAVALLALGALVA